MTEVEAPYKVGHAVADAYCSLIGIEKSTAKANDIGGLLNFYFDMAHESEWAYIEGFLDKQKWEAMDADLICAHLRSTYSMRTHLPNWDRVAAHAKKCLSATAGFQKAQNALQGLPIPNFVRIVLRSR